MTSTPGALFDAPDPGTGIPTDIVWDEYAVDLDAWGQPSGSAQTLTQIDFIPVIVNDDGVDGDRTLQILFFNFDGDTFMGGVNLTYSVPFDYAGWFETASICSATPSSSMSWTSATSCTTGSTSRTSAPMPASA
jgi:hypothetical protein